MNTSESLPITSFIVGAGAVDGAWQPILDALKPHHDFPLTPDGANAFLARLVYLVRFWSTSESPGASLHAKRARKLLIEIRSSMCRSIRQAEEKGRLKVRPQFEEIVRKHVLFRSANMMLVTTNWDNVVGSSLKKLLSTRQTKFEPNPLHIHGNALTPNVMYLPTEMTKEPYRSQEEERRIGRMHSAIWDGMEKCHRSVVYGLSISPLDAELGQILACGWDTPELREIVVIAPDHEAVAHRVNLLLSRKRDISVKGYDPSDLSKPTDYSVVRYA